MRDSIDYKCPKCGELLVLQRPKGLRIFKSVTTFTCPECGKEFEVDDIEFSDEIVSAAEEADAMSNDIAYSYAVRQFDDIDLNSTSDEEIEAYIEMFEDTLSNYNFKPEYRSKLLDMLSLLNWVINREDKAFEYVNESINEGGNEINSVMLACYYASQSELDVFDDARQLYNCLYGLSLFRQCPNGYLLAQDVYKDAFENCTKKYVEHFLDIPVTERKFIVFSEEFNVFPDNFYVLPLNMVHQSGILIDGEPQENELYLCHPYKPNKYFRARDYAIGLFRDKVLEFKNIMVSLGAKTLSFSDVQESESNMHAQSTHNANFNGNIMGKGSLNASIDHTTTEEQQRRLYDEIAEDGEYCLVSYPSLPDDLVWYPHDEKWQIEVKHRLDGRTIRANYTISLNSSESISKSKQAKIKADLDTLIGNASGEYSFNEEVFQSLNLLHKWKCSVEFYPLSDYKK